MEYRISNSVYRVSNIEYQISNIEYRISNTKYQMAITGIGGWPNGGQAKAIGASLASRQALVPNNF